MAQADLIREYVGGAAGKNAENDMVGRACVARDTINGFIDGAIASRRENALAAAIRGLGGHLAGGFRAGGGEQTDAVSGALEDGRGAIQPRALRTPQPPGKGVVNNAYTMK
jgi:hypothetical protein